MLTLLWGGLGCAGGLQGRRTVRVIEGRPQASRYVSPSAYQHYLATRLLLARGDGDGALRELRAALLFDEESPYLYTELARVLASRGRLANARQALAKALALAANYPDALLLSGDLAAREGKSALADALYRRCAQHAPRFASCTLRLANRLEEAGKPAAARSLLEAYLARHEKSARVQQRLAKLCLRTLDLRCAGQHYQLALRKGTTLGLLLRLATVHRGLGDFETATRYLREAFDRTDGNLRVAAELLEVLAQRRQAQAIDDLFAVLRKEHADDVTKLARVAELLVRRGRAAKALALLSKKGLPADPALAVARGLALAKLSRADAARAALASALVGKQGPWAAVELARLWREAGETKRALQVLSAARERYPKNAGIVRALCTTLLADNQAAAAVTAARKALTANPKDVQLTFVLATALHRQGRWRDAVALVQALTKAQPNNAAAHNFLGFTLAEHSVELPRAERAVRRALYLEPGQAYVIDSLGWLLYRKNQLAEARRVLAIAGRLAPDEAEIAAHRGEVAAALKRQSEARAFYQRAISLDAHGWEVARWRRRLEELRAGRVGKR